MCIKSARRFAWSKASVKTLDRRRRRIPPEPDPKPWLSAGDAAAKASQEPSPGRALDRSFPDWMRNLVRTRESGLLAVAALIGVASGLLVAAMRETVQYLHELLFQIPAGAALSVTTPHESWRIIAIPTLGGAVLAALTLWAGDRFRGRQADAIEANALHGGRLSTGGSLYISVQTLISNGFGASVGLEAAYTQMGGLLGSWLGRGLGARRADMRLLLACGAAGGIAAAFHAPLTGAFYAFEVVLGAYSVISLGPVAISSILAVIASGAVSGEQLIASARSIAPVSLALAAHAVLIAILAAGASIALMRGVALIEKGFDALSIDRMLRPIFAGIMVGGLALIAPEALSAGHGARAMVLTMHPLAGNLLLLLAIKGLSSAISLGGGFRGGLFFASLLIGAAMGALYALGVGAVAPSTPVDSAAFSILGMAAVGAGVIGSPMAMTFLALETTGDFRLAVAALLSSALAGLIVRETFGYSFATWRFHLRGEAIRGPQDVGWVRDLKTSRLMRKDFRVVAPDRMIAAARILFPVGAVKEIFLADDKGAYVGAFLVSDLHGALGEEARTVADLAHWRDDFLLPQTTIREALDIFERCEADVLPVLDEPRSRRIVGTLSEAHALRQYGLELEKRNRDLIDR
jgi:chloride channel protein, CIC family